MGGEGGAGCLIRWAERGGEGRDKGGQGGGEERGGYLILIISVCHRFAIRDKMHVM